MQITEDKINPIVIDLSAAKSNKLNESFLRIFGWAVSKLLNRMFGGAPVPVQIKGSPAEIESFANTLANEKRYLQSWQNYGLDDPRTYKDQALLRQSINKFERTTDLKWPFQ
jgi:hypothetical protein